MFKFSRKQLCIPYGLFLVLFVIEPLLVIINYALTKARVSLHFLILQISLLTVTL